MLKYSLSYFDRTFHPNFVRSHFIAPLSGRGGPACSIRSAPNPHKPLPDRRLDEALLKHAGSLREHVWGVDSTNVHAIIKKIGKVRVSNNFTIDFSKKKQSAESPNSVIASSASPAEQEMPVT